MATTVGIRELKNNLSAFVRRAAGGEVVVVTAHGRPVARLSPAPSAQVRSGTKFLPPEEEGHPMAAVRPLHLPKGTACKLINWDRNGR